MSFLHLAGWLIFWYVAGAVVPQLLTPIVGEQNANIIFFGGIALWLTWSFVGSFFRGKNIYKNMRILPRTSDIPEDLQTYAHELQQLGFGQAGVYETKLGRKTVHTYVYANRSRNIMAYIFPALNGIKSHVRFSCYLPDGFDVSTDYPYGQPSKSKKIILRVVKSSLQEAFEYHTHHVRQHIRAHGKPKAFTSLQELLNWESNQAYGTDSAKTELKRTATLWIRIVISIVAGFVVNIAAIIALVGYNTLVGQPGTTHLSLMMVILGILTPIVGLLWAFKPLYSPETVESRKKRMA